MGDVINMVSISDKAKALCAIEAERSGLYADARRLTEEQFLIMARAQEAVMHLGKQQEAIIGKMSALEDSAQKIIKAWR